MKKVLALGLALVLVLSLAACGGKKAEAEANPQPKVTDNADEVSDNMTSSDGKYEVAFVTDVGQLKDKSFNQGTYDGVKLYANNNGLSYKYYQPANGDQATDDDRYDAMKSACENGAKVVVAAGHAGQRPGARGQGLSRHQVRLHRRLGHGPGQRRRHRLQRA
jgi:basic membrane protein A